MILGVLQVELFLPESGSLKEKRMVLKSIKDRIRNRFNVSLAEVDYQDKWQRTTLGIVTVGSEKRFLNSVLDQIQSFLENEPAIQIVDVQMEID